MKTGLPNATKEQKKRFRLLKEEVGCICCRLDTGEYNPANVHHLLDTGTRRGHDFTIPLCEGEHINHHTGNELSYHRTKRKFRETYGSDDWLLEVTNTILEKLSERMA